MKKKIKRLSANDIDTFLQSQAKKTNQSSYFINLCDQVLQYEPLDESETLFLLEQVASGNANAVNTLFFSNLRNVLYGAYKIHLYIPHYALEDLFVEGYCQLFHIIINAKNVGSCNGYQYIYSEIFNYYSSLITTRQIEV